MMPCAMFDHDGFFPFAAFAGDVTIFKALAGTPLTGVTCPTCLGGGPSPNGTPGGAGLHCDAGAGGDCTP